MRIGIDMLGMESPDHRGRGIGRYCTELLACMFREASSHRFVFYRHDGLSTDGLPEGPNTSIGPCPGTRREDVVGGPGAASSPLTRTVWIAARA